MNDKNDQELRDRLKAFVMNHVQEVYNILGGTVGYRLNLTAEQTEQLLKLIEKP